MGGRKSKKRGRKENDVIIFDNHQTIYNDLKPINDDFCSKQSLFFSIHFIVDLFNFIKFIIL